MNTFFSAFGKVAFFLLIVGVLVGGGFLMGKRVNVASLSEVGNKTMVVVTPVVSDTQAAQPSVTGTIPVSPTTTPSAGVTVSIVGVAPFSSFTMVVATGWSKEQTTLVDRSKLTLSNAGYKLIISRGAGGAGACAYPGTPPSDFASPMNEPIEITGVSGMYRRATAKSNLPTGPQTFTICDKKSDSWGFPTLFGYITYETPEKPSDAMLLSMDLMLASLKK